MLCPTPHKIPYRSIDEASVQLRHFKRNNRENKKITNQLHAYKCQCGSFHLGHNKYKRVRA